MTDRPPVYAGTEPYIFVSYAHADAARVLPLIQALQGFGFRVWYDAGIEAAAEWPEYIASHLKGSACVVAFISGAAVVSPNCRREIHYAIKLGKDPLVVYLEEVALPDGMDMQLGPLQALFCLDSSRETACLSALSASRLLAPCRDTLPKIVSYPPAYGGDKPFVFVSFAPEDLHRVLPLLRSMTEQGIRIWYDTGITGEDPETVSDRLLSCTMHLVFLSHAALESSRLRDELGFSGELGRKPVPVCLEEVPLPPGTEALRIQPGDPQSFLKELALLSALALPQNPKPVPTPAECLRRSKEYLDRGEYRDAVIWLRKAARQGSAPGQYRLGCCLLEGLGVPQNRADALRWLRAAAQQAHPEAQYRLGCCLLEGSREDRAEAITWMRKAADRELPDAICKLGYCRATGLGLSQDFREAVRLFRDAARRGSKNAQWNLGVCYETGRGVPRNLNTAAHWYLLAGDSAAANRCFSRGEE